MPRPNLIDLVSYFACNHLLSVPSVIKILRINALLPLLQSTPLVDKNMILQTQPGNKTSKTKPAKQRA